MTIEATPAGNLADLARAAMWPTAPDGQPVQLLTTGEVAALFEVDIRTVGRWGRHGWLSYIRTPGGHRRFFDHEVRVLLKARNDGGQVGALLAEVGRLQDFETAVRKALRVTNAAAVIVDVAAAVGALETDRHARASS